MWRRGLVKTPLRVRGSVRKQGRSWCVFGCAPFRAALCSCPHRQGIHNTFIVAPQFLVTGLASIIFAVFEPNKSVIHGGKRTASQNTTGTGADDAWALVRRDDTSPQEVAASGPNTIAIIFRCEVSLVPNNELALMLMQARGRSCCGSVCHLLETRGAPPSPRVSEVRSAHACIPLRNRVFLDHYFTVCRAWTDAVCRACTTAMVGNHIYLWIETHYSRKHALAAR